jgi:hypothetical protein
MTTLELKLNLPDALAKEAATTATSGQVEEVELRVPCFQEVTSAVP